jgi:ribose 5-phosphate isomerase B
MADKVYIGADHAGYEMKEELEQFLKSKGVMVEDLGTHSTESADYPDFAHLVAEKVAADHESIGILLCGSANGVCITANKHKTIRAALAWNEEIAMLARAHNDANVLCIPSRYISIATAEGMVTKFLSTAFEGGRHLRRVEKI